VTDFAVPTARTPVRGAFTVPPSKSLQQRALVLAALADGDVRLELAGREPPGDDVLGLGAALERLGRWTGGALGTSRERLVLDLGLGATGLRFATALAALRPPGARTLLRGAPRLLRRPHGPLLRALTRLGARWKRRRSGSIRVLGGGMRGRELSIPAGPSSQYASALLLVAPRIGGLSLRFSGPPVSLAYLRMTLDALRAFGVPCREEGLDGPRGRVEASAAAPRCERFAVEPDASAAAAWWTAAALTGGEAWVLGLPRSSSQPDVALLGILERMGAVVDRGPEGSARVAGSGTWLRAPGDVDLGNAPDLVPLVAVLAASAEGATRIRGAAHARAKESDRLATVAAGLRALGGAVEETEDGLAIEGVPLRGAVVDVAGDHRLAFAFGVLGLSCPGVVLRGAEAASKSHPGFLGDLEQAARGT
jgi:3-phosphoshikimate 1-carboxyvinyltransferase